MNVPSLLVRITVLDFPRHDDTNLLIRHSLRFTEKDPKTPA